MPIKGFLLSRKTVLTLICLILGAVSVAYVFPQRFSTLPGAMEKWAEAHPFWAQWVVTMGLDHVYSTVWFAALLFIFLLVLAISTVEQARVCRRRIFGSRIPSGGNGIELDVSEEHIAPALRRHGYLVISRSEEGTRFVKHPWGYGGNVLLHLGIAVTILSSLMIVLTEKRGLLRLAEGEIHFPGLPWATESTGLFAGGFTLPEAVTVRAVYPEFWETDDLKQLTTEFAFVDPQGQATRKVVGINRTAGYRGLKLYQGTTFGDAFAVEFVDGEDRKTGAILELEKPVRRDKASYGDFRIQEIPYLIKAKYFAHKERKSMTATDPLLVLRLVDGERVAGEVSLIKGESGPLGPYQARLVGTKRWVGIIFVYSTGMPGIFLGFLMMIAGAGLTYFMPPRELHVTREGDRTLLVWRASRFGNIYRDEFDRIRDALERLQ